MQIIEIIFQEKANDFANFFGKHCVARVGGFNVSRFGMVS